MGETTTRVEGRRAYPQGELTIDLVGEPATFGGVPFNLVAKMHMPAGFDPGKDQSAFAHHRTQIHRVNVYEFAAGRESVEQVEVGGC